MNSILYELERTLRSKFVLVMMGIIVLIGALLAYAIYSSGSPSVPRAERGNLSDIGVFTLVDAIFGVLIPILAVFMGYLTYGKDRTSGVLESVVTRPVTKGELVLTRFIASVIAILIALVIATFIIDVGQYSYYYKFIPANMIEALIWTYLVEGAGFLGLVYLFSHLLKSQSAVLGISIGIYLIFALLWNLVETIVLVEVFHANLGSLSSLQGMINFNFGSPSGYTRNLVMYITNSSAISGIIGPSGNKIDPASYGITLVSLGVIGIAWMVVPVIITYILSKRFD